MYSESFIKALTFTLRWEGGYVNDSYDKGGPTNKGITQRTYDNYCSSTHIPNRPVKDISNKEVKDIYYNNYWLKAGCNKESLKVAIALFDFAVNSGVHRATRYLATSHNNLEAYLDRREAFYKAIAVGSNRRFLKGWLNRLQALRTYLEGVG